MKFIIVLAAVLFPFTILAQAPVITSFNPTIANSGATVTITGTDFTGATAVSFGGTPAASFTVDSPTQITAVVASGTSGDVSVTTPVDTGLLAGFTFDDVPPTVIITSSATDPTNASPFPVTITFNESVTGFVQAGITVTNGSAGSFSGSGTTYSANITPAGIGAVTVSVAAGVAVDAATNGNTASNILSRTYDNVGPSVSITSTATNPTNTSPFPVTITFNESVTGFALVDISVSNGTAGSFGGSGTTYTANITPTAAGVVTVNVAAGVAVDAATNGNTASNILSRTYDNVGPSVVITSTATDPTNASPFPVTITFSESVTGFVSGDITVSNGTAAGFAGSGTTYTANITPTAAGVVTISVAANKGVDAATNGNTASNILSRTFDNVGPSVSITSTATNPTNASPFPVTITFNESVTGFVSGDITVSNGTAGGFAGSGTTYTANITPTAAGVVTVSVVAGVAVDAATNGNTASNILSRTYDNVGPSVVITSSATDPTNASPFPVTITFSESVTGFVLGDISVSNGTAGSFGGSGTTYTANITPAGIGPVTVSVAANKGVDAATNGNTASNILSRTYDNVGPSVVITSTATDPTNASPFPVTITFNESVTGFVLGDISVSNGTAGSFGGSGTTYTANITPAGAGVVTVSVSANKAIDAATNGNTASNILSITYDNSVPSVVITSLATEPTKVSPIPVTITFSESVTGFAVGDITVTNGTAGSFAGSGTTYTANITPSAAGVVTVSVAAGVAVDASTNGNTASNILSRTYDNVAPSVIITSTAIEPTKVSPIPITISFSESVTGFAVGDITVTNGTAGSFAGSGTTYTANITPSAAGVVTVSVAAGVVADAATNVNTASNLLSRTYDNVAPTVVISSTASEPTKVSPIPITITFSESVTGFAVGDITVTNGMAGSFAGSGTTYTASITPTAVGVVTVSVAAGVVTDAATNVNTASNVLSRTFDNVAPSVVITSTATEPTKVSPIPVTITFSESVTGFAVGDITVTNGTAGSFAGSGTTYTANITPTAAGVVTVSLAAGVIADAATNGNTASNILSRTFDNVGPTVVITSTATEPTNLSPIPVTITFSESVTGFAVGDITVTNGTAGGFAGSGTTYTANITPTAIGLVTVSVAVNKAVDAATNGNSASNILSRTFDNSVPSVIITSTAAEPTNVTPIPVTITFSESVTGLVVGDITVTNGTAGSFAGSGTTYTAAITPTAQGVVTVSVAAGVAADASTNGNTASNLLSRTFDNVAPGVVITSSATEPTKVSPIPVTITFNESVTGFTVGDITVTNGTAGSFAGSGTTYTANITPTANGVVTISIAANSTADAATNGNTASNILSRIFDNVGPSVIITSTAPNPTSVSPIPVTITFSESVTGFILSDISVTNGTATSFVEVNTTTYTLSITPTAIGVVTVSIAANVAVDAATNGNISSLSVFTFVPSITSLTPSSGPVGASVTIIGTGFNVAPAINVVTFNGIEATVTSSTSTTIDTSVPGPVGVTAGVGTIVVTVNGQSASSSFTVLPTISFFSPLSGAEGASITITGTGFSSVLSENVVRFSSNVTAVVTASTNTTITALVPAGATNGKISVTVNGITQNSSSNFNVLSTPIISGFVPASGAVGTTVVISGSFFSTNPVDNIVKFNGVLTTVSASTANSITTTVPPGATDGPISVTTSGVTVTTGSTFDVLATPTITSFSPPSGAVGATVTITGSNFAGTLSVSFNGVAAVITSSSATSITTTVPTGAGTGPINVTSSGITISSASPFTVLPSPTISSFSPSIGAVGAAVIISGTNFSTTAANNTVTFNGIVASVTSSTATSISTTVPSGASTGKISVTTSGVTINSSSDFTVLPSPSISGFAPANGAVGATIIISGTNFSTTPTDNQITFNGVPAVVTLSTGTSITTTVPMGASTGPITLTLNGISVSGGSNFTVLPNPTISSFTPASGAVGATITIIGTNFRPSPQVFFNGISSVISTSNATSIVTTVPAGATTGPIIVSTAGVPTVSASDFTVLPTPSISGFSPASGAVGASVTITGNNFSTIPTDHVVKFNNNKTAIVTASSINSITTSVPAGAISGVITVTVSGVTVTSGTSFTVLPTPTISSFNPVSGIAGTPVTITGTNFNTTPANNLVEFNGIPAVVTASTVNSITTSVPAGAGTGPISITVSGVTINSASNFTVFGTPSITGFSPTNGTYGTVVVISGSNFSLVSSENTVDFNGTTSVVTASSATSITTTVPFGATTGPISVMVNNITGTSATNFTIPTPIISSFTPTSGAVGATVTLTGSYFNNTPANNIVKFNGVAATVSASNSTSITTKVPAGATTGKITVTVGGVTGTSSSDFTVLPTPTIDSFTPNSGAVDAIVTITGTNFSTTPTNNIIKFNNTIAIVTLSTATSITTTVPVGATTGKISITLNNVTISSAQNFTVLPKPTITSLSPSSGALGAIVTINGTNFSSTPAVSFNGVVAEVTASTATSITTKVPEGAATGPIIVTTSGVTVNSATNFTVLPTPTIVNFAPVSGAEGATITITGTHFSTTQANNVVKFNGVTAVVTASTANSITTTVPVGALTGNITITVNGVTITSTDIFTVLSTPTITGFSPGYGAFGAVVIITGTNFSPTLSGNVVQFNEVPTEVTDATETSITVTVPVGSTTGRIKITVSGVTITSATSFIVMPSPSITNFSPLNGIVGATVNITGLNFDSDEPDNVVTFNGTNAIVVSSSTTAITTNVPEGATSGKICVTVNGATVCSAVDFTVLQIIPDDTTPPVLVIDNTLKEVIQGSDHKISAQFDDPETKIISAIVRVVSPSSGTDINIPLVKSGNNWEFVVPALLIGELGIEYEFTVTNEKTLVYHSPSLQLVKVRIPGNGLTLPYTFFGAEISNYRIISVPLDLDKPAVSDVLDELPALDKTQWRISHYDNPTNTNKELLTTSTLQPGLGYWLLIKDKPVTPVITTGTGTTVNILPAFTIPLKAGWNQIGNPYNFNLLWSDLVTANPGLPISFRSYNGNIKNFENKTTINVMEGGFINVAADMQLVYPVKKNINGRINSPQATLENSIDQTDWEIDFKINQGDISNVIGGLGMRQNAVEGFDIYDGFSMPHFAEFLDLNHEKKLNQYHYSKDVIPTSDSYTWNFKIDASNTEKPAAITWNNSYLGNNNLNLILLDEQSNIWIDMKQHTSYSFTPPVNFKVIYGSENYVTKEIGHGNAKIIEVSPNPAHGPISIHMFLPDWQKKFPVQLDLKSLTGISVANIFTGELESGYQKIEWSGENNSNKLPSGVYLVQMRSNNTIQTVRLILIN